MKVYLLIAFAIGCIIGMIFGVWAAEQILIPVFEQECADIIYNMTEEQINYF